MTATGEMKSEQNDIIFVLVNETVLRVLLSTGFLQVRENLKKSGNLCHQGKSWKGQGKYYF